MFSFFYKFSTPEIVWYGFGYISSSAMKYIQWIPLKYIILYGSMHLYVFCSFPNIRILSSNQSKIYMQK